MSDITPTDFSNLFLAKTPLIDVRAPIEFVQGCLPGAVNLPIMNDEERALVGTAYKKEGREKAIALGHELVSGKTQQSRIEAWIGQIRQNPETVLYCFRGGLRSKITQRWLSERGVHRPLIQGGYKNARQYLRETIEWFSTEKSMLMLSGSTGSAKTHFLRKAMSFYPSVDLEKYADHRGSAFGALNKTQPSQINFEHDLAIHLIPFRQLQQPILVEDESRLIGRCALPESFFKKMRSSPLLYLEVSFEQRVENIFQDYILQTALGRSNPSEALLQFQIYRQALVQISRKLGGARTQEIMKDLDFSEKQYLLNSISLDSNKIWIEKLLRFYYDPFYNSSLQRRDPKILVRGGVDVLTDYLKAVGVGAI